MSLSENDLLETAKEIRKQVRARAGLELDWDKASPAMRAWYLMLARRAEGVEKVETRQ